MGIVVRQMAGGGQVDGDVALVAQGDEQVVVRGVGGTPEPKLRGEAGLRGVESPEGSKEPVARGPANQGVGVVQVPDIDAEEVGEPDDRGWGDANPSFGNLAEEMGRGGEGPSSGGAYGRGGHSVHHAHGSVGGGADTGKPVDRPVALGDEHGEGVVGRQLRGSEHPARGAGAGEQAPGVDGVEEVGEGVAAKDADVVLARGASHRVAVQVHRVSEEVDPAIAHVHADQDRIGRV